MQSRFVCLLLMHVFPRNGGNVLPISKLLPVVQDPKENLPPLRAQLRGRLLLGARREQFSGPVCAHCQGRAAQRTETQSVGKIHLMKAH